MLRRPAVLLATALLAVSATALPADAAPRREPASVTVTTQGNGHGKGLSQYGARNRANAGQTYRQIIGFYYPRTAWGTAGGSIRVQITGDTTTDVQVSPRAKLTARSLGTGKRWTLPAKRAGKKITRWRIVPASGHRSSLAYRTNGWHTWRTARGDMEFSAGGAPITLRTPSGAVPYRGTLRSASANASGTARDTVNVVPLEHYLRGVVPKEVPASWPAHAVRAQAVAARTYAAFERANVSASRHYDLCDTPSCQVYLGYDAEHSASTAAVVATAKRIVTHGGKPAFAQFSASNGGYSVDGGYPYLVAKEDTFDKGIPGDPSSRTFTGPEVTRHWAGLGDLVRVEVLERDGRGKWGGRVLSLRVVGTEGSQVTTGSAFRSFLGLRSTLLQITQP